MIARELEPRDWYISKSLLRPSRALPLSLVSYLPVLPQPTKYGVIVLKNDPEINGDLSTYSSAEINTLNAFKEQLENFSGGPGLLMSNFSRFVRFQDVTRFLTMYEIYKKIMNVHGSIVEIGVLNGFNIFSFAHFCEIFEQRNYTRKVLGFDTFEGHQSQNQEKDGEIGLPQSMIGFATHAFDELQKSVALFNNSIQFNQFEKIRLVKGDAVKTIPEYVDNHPELLVSLLICYTDIYEPTKVALEKFWPRMPKGGVVLISSSNYEKVPGEINAFNDVLGIGNFELKRFSFATRASYIIK